MLLGLFKAAKTSKQFQVAFDWFFEYLKVLEVCMEAFDGDDEVVHLVLKVMQELTDNSEKRLSVWSENGLIIFKEVSSLLIKFMERHGHFGFRAHLLAQDKYRALVKYVRRLVAIVKNLVVGGYVNIAACQFYGDQSFKILMQGLFQVLLGQDAQLLVKYRKVQLELFNFLGVFIRRNHMFIFQ